MPPREARKERGPDLAYPADARCIARARWATVVLTDPSRPALAPFGRENAASVDDAGLSAGVSAPREGGPAAATATDGDPLG